MAVLEFSAMPFELPADHWTGGGTVVRMPEDLSILLPSRGMCMVSGEVDGKPFETTVEPDGEGSHWFKVPASKTPLHFKLEQAENWREPKVPPDIKAVIESDPKTLATWNDITPAARWEWIRWAAAVRQAETRAKRVNSIPSRMASGKRRPCCFDRSQCTLTDA